MVACRQFQSISAQRLYADVSVSGYTARKCFTTLNGRSSRSEMYARSIRRLSYSLGNDSSLLSFPMLCITLGRAISLKTLAISVPPDVVSFLIEVLRWSDFIRQSHTPFQFFRDNETPTRTSSVPHLESFCLRTSIQLLDTIKFRPIKAISVTKLLTYEDLDRLIDVLDRPREAPCLKDLRIRLHENLDIHSVLTILSKIFPTISLLAIEQRRMDPMVHRPIFAYHHF